VRALRSERGQTAVEYVGVLLVAAAVVAVILSAGIGDQVAAKVSQAICQIATDRRECADEDSAAPALARAAPNLYGAQARPALARMSFQGAKPLPLAARSEEETRAARSEEKLRDAALKGATAQFDLFASLAQLGLPGSAELGKAGTLSGEQVLPFEQELNTVVDELSGTADAERAIAAFGEGRFGDALLSGFFAMPFAKPFKAAKWVVKGVGWAGKGLAGVVRRLGPRAKRVWRKLADERGSVGGRGRAGKGADDGAGAGARGHGVPARRFVSTPRGTTFDVPGGWASRTTDNGRGIVYQRPGATGRADSIRIMEPTSRYPDGYFRYYNSRGQPLDINGKPGPNSATHIPEKYIGRIPGWPTR
jgi:Flp pilus assembly pilin Flp